MLIHEVTAKLRPALELRHPGAEILFGAVFNTDLRGSDSGTAYLRINEAPYRAEYSIQLGAVVLDCQPLFSDAPAVAAE